MNFYPWLLWLTPREIKLREHSELAAEEVVRKAHKSRRCPRCRIGYLAEYDGVCRTCRYPEFSSDEPCNECEEGDCDECEYARELRKKLKEKLRISLLLILTFSKVGYSRGGGRDIFIYGDHIHA